VKIGRLGAKEFFAYDVAHFAHWGAECISLKEPRQLSAVDGLLLSAEFPEQLALNRHWCRAILQHAQQNLPIWGCGYGAYLLAKGKSVPLLDCRARFVRRSTETVLLLTVPLWEERFAVRCSRQVRLEQPAPNLAVLAKSKEEPVILRQGNVLACTFLPCQTNYGGMYGYFIEMVARNRE